MNTKTQRLASVALVCLLALLVSLPVFAQDYDVVRERISSLTNSAASPIIAETPIDGLLQVRLGSEVVYMTDDARFLVQGRVLDLDTRVDLTDQAKAELRREAIADIQHESLISFGPEDADHELMVFTDVDCGFCRKLHHEMDQYNEAGIRIHYLAFPRAGVGSETFNKMQSVWCAEDPNAAMDIAKDGDTPLPMSCDSPVMAQYELGQSLGVTGTPALVTHNGDLIPGYVPAADLRARLELLQEAAD
ncbi:MAG: DsbC family protein [Pseudomonadota bacterium]